MRPVQMTMERVRQMDSDCREEVRPFRQCVKLSNFEHEDNAIALLLMAQNLRVSFDELCSYVWLQTYIAELSESFDDIFSVEFVAQQFGIDVEEFQEYLDLRAEQLQAEDKFQQEIQSNKITDSEFAELAVKGFTPVEWSSYLDDLQDDAAATGD